VASENQDEPKELLVLNHWQSKRLAKHVMWKLKSIMKAAYVDCLSYSTANYMSVYIEDDKVNIPVFGTKVKP
jgi:hypothetical protein